MNGVRGATVHWWWYLDWSFVRGFVCLSVLTYTIEKHEERTNKAP